MKSPLVETLSCPACSQKAWSQKNEFFQCQNCATVVMPQRKNFSYSESYQQDRGHYDSEIRLHKIDSFQTFLKQGNLNLKNQDHILELGFGGGAILEHLWNTQHPHVFGIEAHNEAILQLAKKQIPQDHLAVDLKSLSTLKKPLDHLLYLDSFEHLLDPHQHLNEIANYVQKGTKALVVLPRADSFSRFVMGSFWPHNVPDHWIFYSRKGLLQIWEQYGWRPVREWNPRKKISFSMILRHAGLKKVEKFLPAFIQKTSFWIQLGELGVVFEKL